MANRETTMRTGRMNDDEELPRNPKAAPVFTMYVILKSPSTTGIDSCRDIFFVTMAFVA
jgi:hypothetical protein